MNDTTTVEGKLECSSFLTVLYEDRFAGPGVLVLGDSLYRALFDATDAQIVFGAAHVIRGRAKIVAKYSSCPFKEFSMVLYDVKSYSFVEEGSHVELQGVLTDGSNETHRAV